MRFFHISDLHIGLKLVNMDLSEDQSYILGQIVEQVRDKKPQALVIAGDIYNNSIPSAEAIEIFDTFISDLKKARPELVIMAISGNHDNMVRINQFRAILSSYGLHFIGIPPMREGEYIEKIVMEDEYGEVNFYLLPFVKPSYVKKITANEEESLSFDEALHRLIAREDIDAKARNVFVSHQFYLPVDKVAEDVERMESEWVSVGNIDAVRGDILEKFDYSALGHIHKPWKLFGECHRYCGTPLAYSITEEGQDKGIVMVDLLEKGSIKTEVVELKPLRKVRTIRGSLEEVLQDSSNDLVRVVVELGEELADLDMRDRIRDRYPYLLELRVERNKDKKEETSRAVKELGLMDMCREFLKEFGESRAGEEEILREILDEIGGIGDET